MSDLAPQATAASASEPSDDQLAVRARQGDDQAFAALYHRYARRLHHRLFLLTGPGDHLDDLLQQTFMHVHRTLPSFRGEARLSTWLTRITINVAAQHLRQKRRKPPPEVRLEAHDERLQSAPQQLEGLDVERAWALLARLPENLRQPLVLRDLEELTFEEIAAATGAPLSTVVSRLGRAREQIARMLRPRGLP